MRLCALVLIVLAVGGCRSTDALPPVDWPVVQTGIPRHNLEASCVGDYSPGVDYFPEKVTVRYARSFRVNYHAHYKVIDFSPDIGSQETARYVLVQCGTPIPPDLGPAHIVRVPVRRFVLAKPEFSSLVSEFRVLEQLVGISNINAISDPDMLDRHRRGLIHQVGSGTHSSIELALAVHPDVVFTFYSAFADSNTHPKLWDVGITGVPVADHFEPTPLGRSEWMKFMALFFNREAVAEHQFAQIADRYERMTTVTRAIDRRPPVLMGWPSSRQQWSLNGGSNYMAQMIEDAGGMYVWNSESMRSIDLADFERIYQVASDATEWIGNQLGHRRLMSLVSNDSRLRYFGPVERGQVFNNDLGRLASGAFPMATEGLSRPDAVLADLIRILHPELMPGHTLRYYYELH